MANEDLHLGIGVDMRDFAKFARALKKAAPDIQKHLALGLRGVGGIVAEEARANVDEYSQRIADSIKVRVSGATVSVVAGGAGVPMGALTELGNRGGSSGTFRHPVFGSGNWVDQPMQPYLGPAVESKGDAVEKAAIEALDEVFAELEIEG